MEFLVGIAVGVGSFLAGLGAGRLGLWWERRQEKKMLDKWFKFDEESRRKGSGRVSW